MQKQVTVRVPATSANCGPGFDCLGLALTLYNDFTYQISDETFGFSLAVEGEGKERFHASGRNMAFSSFLHLWNKVTNRKRIGIALHMHNQVPQSRGLGSSSTAIVAGITAAGLLSGAGLSNDEILQEANLLEGHPDNVAPAIYGGFTVSIQEEGRAHTLRLLPKLPLQFIAVVPDTPLSTHLARQVIPVQVAHADAVFNASRTALLIAALEENKPELLRFALADRLHQPYRAALIPGMAAAFAAGEAAGAYKCIISGAGSTLLAYAAPEQDGRAIGEAMTRALAEAGQRAVYHLLNLNEKGTEILDLQND